MMDGKSILDAVLETAADLNVNKITMRELASLALPPVQGLTPSQIRKIRERARASQSVMATFLNVGVTTVQKWERGETVPHGAALKLLNLANRNGIESIM